ncbi:hypothetical protein ACWCSD_17460 [Nonomuraea sp. NPDC001684]
MPPFFFPDTTVLSNFAYLGEVALLKQMLDGQGRWTEAVAFEIGNGVRCGQPLDSLASLLGTDPWLGSPILITREADIVGVEALRRRAFAGPRLRGRYTEHLGEAQSCYVILNWPQFQGSAWISDDRKAVRFGRAEGITTYETIDVVRLAIQSGLIDTETARDHMRRLCQLGRPMREPTVADLLAVPGTPHFVYPGPRPGSAPAPVAGGNQSQRLASGNGSEESISVPRGHQQIAEQADPEQMPLF